MITCRLPGALDFESHFHFSLLIHVPKSYLLPIHIRAQTLFFSRSRELFVYTSIDSSNFYLPRVTTLVVELRILSLPGRVSTGHCIGTKRCPSITMYCAWILKKPLLIFDTLETVVLSQMKFRALALRTVSGCLTHSISLVRRSPTIGTLGLSTPYIDTLGDSAAQFSLCFVVIWPTHTLPT